MKEKIRNKIFLAAILLMIITNNQPDYEYHPEYEILEGEEAYACYRDGNIYIGDEKYLRSINCESKDVLIYDNRNSERTEFKIYDSYRIRDKEARNDIIEVLMQYEDDNPTNWHRTKESMRLEWYLHNLSYDLFIKRSSTSDVDLDTVDESIYDNKILRKILKL